MVPRVRSNHNPSIVARFDSLEQIRTHKEWAGLEVAIPATDRESATCKPTGPFTLAEFAGSGSESRALFLQYPGCCETRCRKDPISKETECGRQLFSIPCRKDVLVEGRERRYAALTASAFSQFDPTAGKPKTRIFRFDLDADGTPEIVRWEELRQHQHTEWKLEAFRGTKDGLRRVADIRFYHAGPWRPDLNFSARTGQAAREIEIAVQDVDASRHIVVRRHIYRFDRLLQKYTMAKTEVSTPPELNPPQP